MVPLIERVAASSTCSSRSTPTSPPSPGGDRRRGARSSTTSAACATRSSRTSARETGAALVVMHTRAAPKQRLQDPDLYGDVVEDVLAFLGERIALALAPASRHEQLIVDPGPDFAKTPAQTIELLRRAASACTSSGARADGALAQGLHRRPDRARAARARRGHARGARRTASTSARTSSACTTSRPPADFLAVRAALARASARRAGICSSPRSCDTSGPPRERCTRGPDRLRAPWRSAARLDWRTTGAGRCPTRPGRQPPNPTRGETHDRTRALRA